MNFGSLSLWTELNSHTTTTTTTIAAIELLLLLLLLLSVCVCVCVWCIKSAVATANWVRWREILKAGHGVFYLFNCRIVTTMPAGRVCCCCRQAKENGRAGELAVRLTDCTETETSFLGSDIALYVTGKSPVETRLEQAVFSAYNVLVEHLFWRVSGGTSWNREALEVRCTYTCTHIHTHIRSLEHFVQMSSFLLFFGPWTWLKSNGLLGGD